MEKQAHQVTIIFPGTMDELLKEFGKHWGLSYNFYPPGLVNSAGVLEFYKTEKQTKEKCDHFNTEVRAGETWCYTCGRVIG